MSDDTRQESAGVVAEGPEGQRVDPGQDAPDDSGRIAADVADPEGDSGGQDGDSPGTAVRAAGVSRVQLAFFEKSATRRQSGTVNVSTFDLADGDERGGTFHFPRNRWLSGAKLSEPTARTRTDRVPNRATPSPRGDRDSI